MSGNGFAFDRLRPRWRFWVALAGAVLVAVVLIIGRVAGGEDKAGQTPPPRQTAAPPVTATPSGTTTASPSVTPGDDSVAGTPASGTAPAAAVRGAVNFVKAWAGNRPGMKQQDWWRAVSRYADPTLASQLKATDPTTIEATTVTGAPRSIAISATSAQVMVPTDTGDIEVLMVDHGTRWLAATVNAKGSP